MAATRTIPDKLILSVCTWNVGGDLGAKGVSPEESLKPLFQNSVMGHPAPDLYLIGVQELVELNVGTAINKKHGDRKRQNYLEQRIAEELGSSYVQVRDASVSMVGLCMLAFVQADLEEYITMIETDHVKTGVGGFAGNKGAVCIRVHLAGVEMFFANVHLAAGQQNAATRSQDMEKIFHDSVAKDAKNHVKVILGDFNSRLGMAKDEPWPQEALSQSAWKFLRCHDDLDQGRIDNLTNFNEGAITFAPTYKYHVGSLSFNHERVPAWCDRILFLGKYSTEVECLKYQSCPTMSCSSDHRPVVACLRITLSDKERQQSIWKKFLAEKAHMGASLFNMVLSALPSALPTIRRCTNAHPLGHKVTKKLRKCHSCGLEILEDTTFFHCESCNFHCCQGCSSLKGTISFSMRSADRLCIRKMKLKALHESGIMMHFRDSGYDLDHKMPADVDWVEVTFSVMGGSRVYAVDRSHPQLPWARGPAGDYKREYFKYQKPPVGFGVRFTLKGMALHTYVAQEEIFEL